MKNDNSVREMSVNYILYPGEELKIKERLESLLDKNNSINHAEVIFNNTKDKSLENQTVAVVSPHGGWVHCDNIMGAAYRSVMNRKIKTVIILSRVHREPSRALFLPDYASYKTPLGELQVDQTILKTMAEGNKLFTYDNIPHMEEHSIEVQLPFIKYLWPEAKIIPILTGKSLTSITKILSNTLRDLFINRLEETLFIISSGLSSYDTAKKTEEETSYFLSLLRDSKTWITIPELVNQRIIGACSADCISAVIDIFKPEISLDLISLETGHNLKPEEKRVCFGAISLKGVIK